MSVSVAGAAYAGAASRGTVEAVQNLPVAVMASELFAGAVVVAELEHGVVAGTA